MELKVSPQLLQLCFSLSRLLLLDNFLGSGYKGAKAVMNSVLPCDYPGDTRSGSEGSMPKGMRSRTRQPIPSQLAPGSHAQQDCKWIKTMFGTTRPTDSSETKGMRKLEDKGSKWALLVAQL